MTIRDHRASGGKLPAAEPQAAAPHGLAGEPIETDRCGNVAAVPEGGGGAAHTPPSPDYLADVARNYNDAIAAMRERIVASGRARLLP